MVWIVGIATLVPESLVSLIHLALIPLVDCLILHCSLLRLIDAGLGDSSIVSVSDSVVWICIHIWTIWIHGCVPSAKWFNPLVGCLPYHILKALVHHLLWLSWVIEFILLQCLASLVVWVSHCFLGVILLEHAYTCRIGGCIWLSDAMGGICASRVMRFGFGVMVTDHLRAIVVSFRIVIGLGVG